MKDTAYFAGGCFWCITPAFDMTPGVQKVVSGYSGGAEDAPTYEDVKYQRTGHRETIRIDYNSEKVNFATLLEIFLNNVDPFDDGGQFIDRGHSYTLAVYYQNEAQQEASQAALAALEDSSGRKPAIALEPFTAFWPAEEYHQDYYKKNPEAFRKELIESGRIKE